MILVLKATNNKRKILIRDEEPLNPNFGKFPEERTVDELLENGVINLDKPVGPSSHEVTAWIRRILNVRKVAHAGTLEAIMWPGKP